jgi:hypothetical protein
MRHCRSHDDKKEQQVEAIDDQAQLRHNPMSHNPPPPPPPNPQNPSATVSPPHFENPLIAPRPYKLDPGLPANVRRRLIYNFAKIV